MRIADWFRKGTLVPAGQVAVVVENDMPTILMPGIDPDRDLTDMEGYLVACAMIAMADCDGEANAIFNSVQEWLDKQIERVNADAPDRDLSR